MKKEGWYRRKVDISAEGIRELRRNRRMVWSSIGLRKWRKE